MDRNKCFICKKMMGNSLHRMTVLGIDGLNKEVYAHLKCEKKLKSD